ncbi:hypothetical protein [Sphingomonas bacterium]|uniref:hypothetical protein n=1 Tax=Sphingomonas bacterium TaxID=1895847 RepID=UPI0015761151|nr:hypothetical protein [Sphingomonas bacterium]
MRHQNSVHQSNAYALDERVVWRDFRHSARRDVRLVPDALDAARGVMVAIPMAAILWAAAALTLSFT